LKVVIVDTTIDEDLIGGAHFFLPNLIKELVEKGYEIHLVTKELPNEKVRKSILKSGVILHIDLWNKNSLVEKAAPFFANWVNKIKPDVYLISASADIGWVALPFLDPQIATLTIGHTDSETFYLPARHYHSFLSRAIGVSNEVCDQYISGCNLTDEKVDWIPYGVEASSFLTAINNKGVLEIVYVGRIDEKQKRISNIIEIGKELSVQKINYQLKIIGDGPEMSKLKAGLADEINDKKVHLYGWLNSNEVNKLLWESEIFILTSAYKGYCIALIEAMANGCCPVVTDIESGNKQLVTDKKMVL